LEYIKLETALDFMERTDRQNKRLTNVVFCAFITIGIIVLGMTAFYFFADYQYPTTEQQATETTLTQSIK
jgi:hypothetical protein